jgi:uncharacterized membrane protein YdjX (TVP38/TMEM64 family)
MQRATRRQLLGAGCLVAVAAVAAWLVSPGRLLSALQGLATRPLPFGLALCVVFLVRPFLLWPVSGIALGLGYLYGPAVGLPVGAIGAAVTALPPFLVARYADGESGILGAVGGSGRELADAVGETRSVVAVRLSPVPSDAVSYGAGLSEISLGAFFLGTLSGEIPWVVLAVLAGDSMRTLSLSGFSYSPAAVLALAGLGFIVVSGPLYTHLRERTGDATESAPND